MWKIVIVPPGADGKPGSAFVLVDYSDIILDNPNLESDFELEEVRYFRGKAPVYFDRGNEKNVIAFTVSTQWPTLEAALDWQFGVRGQCPRIGDITITAAGYAGGKTNRQLLGAAIKVRSLPNVGVTTFTQVQILGGLVTTPTT